MSSIQLVWPNVRLDGLHMHIGSQLLSLEPVREALARIAELEKQVEAAAAFRVRATEKLKEMKSKVAAAEREVESTRELVGKQKELTARSFIAIHRRNPHQVAQRYLLEGQKNMWHTDRKRPDRHTHQSFYFGDRSQSESGAFYK
jgi:hypothetical protein